MDPIKLILIDLDGVIYDFVNYMLKTHFTFIKAEESDITDYNMAKSLGISKDDFWKACDRADGIFCKGELYDWAQELIDTCRKYCPHIAFCSNPGNNPKHWAEKKVFIDRFFSGENSIPLLTTQNKEILSTHGVVLIDDFDKNYSKFNDGDGIGILFPQYWNSNGIEQLLKDRVGYIDCTLDDINTVGFKQWKEIKASKNEGELF